MVLSVIGTSPRIWSASLVRGLSILSPKLLPSGRSRVVGLIGLAMGPLLIAALGVGVTTGNPLALMAAIAATAVWAVLVGALLLKR